MRILRQSLEVLDYQTLRLDTTARLLSAAPARALAYTERVDLWWLENDEDAGPIWRNRGIYIVGTGHTMPDELADAATCGERPLGYVGTCVMPSDLVWHIFEGPVRH